MVCDRDDRPIGVFDSGLGGLTAVAHMARVLPDERFVYFGDTARTPYGSKAVDTVRKFAVEIAEFLLKQDAKMIVIACNTVSATCLELLRKQFPHIPILGIIEPAARKAAAEWAGKRIGIIGTKVTVASGRYESLILSRAPDCRVVSRACPLLVPAIEEGLSDTPLMEHLVGHYMDDWIREEDPQLLVLGCTHYPLVERIIRGRYPGLAVLDPSEVIAEEVRRELELRGLSAGTSKRENRFYASDLSDSFVRMAQSILPDQKVDIGLKSFTE